MTYQLVARTGPTAGNIYNLEQEEVSVGRDLSNDIVINDPEVSRRHARLIKQGVNYVIEDLGSTNGTLVNGQRITGPHTLYSGEMITLGENITLLYEVEQPAVEGDATVVAGMGGDATIRAAMPVKPVQPPIQTPVFEQPAYTPPVVKEPDYQPVSPPQVDNFATIPDQQDYGTPLPSQPYTPPVAPKKKFPIWIIILIIILLIICVCVVVAVVVDSLNMYCNELSFIFKDILGMCP